MGYQPPPMKKQKHGASHIIDTKTESEIYIHLPILVLRKSARKLSQYCACFKNRKYATRILIDLKYEFSRCRPEVLTILLAMANDPKRFEIDSGLIMRKVLTDSKFETNFTYYNHNGFGDDPKTIKNPRIHINGKLFLTPEETMMMARVIESMFSMKKSEYKLQEELKILEEQDNVFQIYQNEKSIQS